MQTCSADVKFNIKFMLYEQYHRAFFGYYEYTGNIKGKI